MSPSAGSDARSEAELRAPRLDLTISADMDAVNGVVERVLEVAAEDDCAPGSEFEIKTALYEALTNAVYHGCKNDPAKTIRIRVACDGCNGILIVVRDPGEGFDLSSVPSPVHGDNRFTQRGRGIFLIQQLMDEVRYERGGTEIRMRKK